MNFSMYFVLNFVPMLMPDFRYTSCGTKNCGSVIVSSEAQEYHELRFYCPRSVSHRSSADVPMLKGNIMGGRRAFLKLPDALALKKMVVSIIFRGSLKGEM